MLMLTYPSELPKEALSFLIKKISDNASVPDADAAIAAWWTIGYGVGQMQPDALATPDMRVDAVMLTRQLGKFLDPHADGVLEIPWSVVVKQLLTLFSQWYRNKGAQVHV